MQICYRSLWLLTEVCAMLGIPLALEKVEGPSTVLGILLDTGCMEARHTNVSICIGTWVAHGA